MEKITAIKINHFSELASFIVSNPNVSPLQVTWGGENYADVRERLIAWATKMGYKYDDTDIFVTKYFTLTKNDPR